LWNQTLEAEDLQQAAERVEKQDGRDVHQALIGSTAAAQCGKKRRLDPTVRL